MTPEERAAEVFDYWNKNEDVTWSDCMKIIASQIREAVAEEREKGEKLATCIPCPCGDVGYYVVPNRNTGEPEQEQCQFCDTNPDSRFKALKEWRDGLK